jgi:hypothetical protein
MRPCPRRTKACPSTVQISTCGPPWGTRPACTRALGGRCSPSTPKTLFPRQYISFSLFDGLALPDTSQLSATLYDVFALGKKHVGTGRFAFQGDGVAPHEPKNPLTHYN